MVNNSNNYLYQKVKEKGFKPFHVAEVGVWHPETSNIYKFIQDGIKTTLVEPDPMSIAKIKNKFADNSNVILHEAAVCDFRGEIELCKRESSTFVANLKASPAIVNDGVDIDKTEKFTAKAILFSDVDDGSIDLLSIDTEGSEWFVIKNLVSLPIVLSVETHGGAYVNPYLDKILRWAKQNNYKIWFKDKSDTVFALNGKIAITPMEKFSLLLTNIFLKIRFLKKKASRFFVSNK